MLKRLKKNPSNILPLLWIVMICCVCLWKNLQNVNLWHDEAMLAYSVSRRSLFDLVKTPLSYNQSAPVFYIILVKIFTILFGNTEYVLRLPSFLAYILIIGLTYYVADRILEHNTALWEAAFTGTISIIMGYAGEFKQYLMEGCAVLLVIVFYKKLSWFLFIPVAALLMGFGNPVCFIIGGILIYEFLTGLACKDKSRIYRAIAGGFIIMTVFLVYYLYWLRPVINDGYMVDFWTDFKPDLLGRKELKHTLILMRDLLKPYGRAGFVIAPLAIAALIYNLIYDRSSIVVIVFLGFSVALAASFMGRFPLKDRFWLYAYPLVAIFAFDLLKVFTNRKYRKEWNSDNHLILMDEEACQNERPCLNTRDKKCRLILSIICGLAIISQVQFISWLGPDGLKISREEIRTSMEYVRNNIKKDEKCYVYYDALPAFWYENGYDNTSIGAYKNNLIFGRGFFFHGENQEDIDEIIASQKVLYIDSPQKHIR